MPIKKISNNNNDNSNKPPKKKWSKGSNEESWREDWLTELFWEYIFFGD